MEPQAAEMDLDARVQRLEARNRRLERLGMLAFALLIIMSVLLIQQQWSERIEAPMAIVMDENRQPQASVQVTPSGQVRLVSLRPDGSLPRLNAEGASQQGGVTLYDAAGNPRIVLGSGPGAGTTASPSMAHTSAAPSSMPAHANGEHCNLSLPADPREGYAVAAGAAKKEEGQAASVQEERGPDGSRIKTVLFKDLRIEGIRPSMTGPRKMQRLVLGNPSDKEVWITGFKTDVLDGQNNVASPQFMCHAALDVVNHIGADGESSYRRQAFTVSQGQTEIAFPAGFAMPIPTTADLQQALLVQVLNNNDPDLRRDLNFRATLRYFDDGAARQRSLIPLRLTGGSIQSVIDAATARPEEVVIRPVMAEEIFSSDGRRVTGHWFVPPGRQVLATELSLNLTRDTTVHYMWMHIHPYAQSLELRDKTSNQTVWKGLVQNDPDRKRAAVISTDTYSSPSGIPLHHDHKYELIATYQNPTSRDVDAMASLWMYVRDDRAE